MAEAMALIHHAQERRAGGKRERPKTLRRLPRTMQQHRADQVRGVLPERLRQRDEQPPPAADPLRQVGRGGLAEHVAKLTVAKQRS
jgi:hypothetical protein